MDSEEREVAGLVIKHAPDLYRVKWSQEGLKRTLAAWQRERPTDFNEFITTHGVGMLVGWDVRPGSLGDYGYDTDFSFHPDVEEHLIEDDEFVQILHDFNNDWIDNIAEAVFDAVEDTLLTPKQLAVKFMDSDKFMGEKHIADSLGISVGTVRGKKGRIKSKIESARATLSLAEAVEEDDEEQSRYSYDVIEVLEADDLPVYGNKDRHSTILQSIIMSLSYEQDEGVPLDEIVNTANEKRGWSKERVMYELDNLEKKNIIEQKESGLVQKL